MTTSSAQMRRYEGPAIFSFGFRPFFLGAALLAALTPPLTAIVLFGVARIGPAYSPVSLHGHEMIHGYLAAVIAGFVLTAVPNWTGRLPLLGWPLMALFGLWLAGRVAIMSSGAVSPWLAAFVDAPFVFILNAFMWREIIAGKNWRNAPICILIFLFAVGNILWHADILRGGAGTAGLRWSLAVAAVLMALIGGRITPSFTRNWLAKTGRAQIDVSFKTFDKIAMLALAIAMIAWFAAPQHAATGGLLLAASVLHAIRLSRWKGWLTASEPIVTVLHVGYGWLCVAALLMGMSVLAPGAIPASAALHALTAGAIGNMTLAVMTRATLGHTGQDLKADAATLVIYALANIGALLRVAAIWVPADFGHAVSASSVLWSGAFLLFAVIYGPLLARRRPVRRDAA